IVAPGDRLPVACAQSGGTHAITIATSITGEIQLKPWIALLLRTRYDNDDGIAAGRRLGCIIRRNHGVQARVSIPLVRKSRCILTAGESKGTDNKQVTDEG
ncbi:MAG TPA: hypothetical protein VFZ20_09675, partial [Longimicrobium sp.]|nr:hypothetical protein [Longimicrobium sp.]